LQLNGSADARISPQGKPKKAESVSLKVKKCELPRSHEEHISSEDLAALPNLPGYNFRKFGAQEFDSSANPRGPPPAETPSGELMK